MSDAAAVFTNHTEQDPATGAVYVGNSETILSEGLRWFEDGLHVIQSTEFDVSAQHEDADEVVTVFIDNLLDLVRSLYALQESGEATDQEREEFEQLERRMAEISVAELDFDQRQQQRKRDIVQRLRKQRGEHSANWQQRATVRPASSLLSRA